MADKALSLLGMMRRAGSLEPGTDAACGAVRAGRAKILLMCEDAADNARRKAENAAEGRNVLLLPTRYTREELSAALGLGDCSMAAVTDIGFADALMKELAALDPERYSDAAALIAGRHEKTARRRREKAKRADSKRNGKRRTEV